MFTSASKILREFLFATLVIFFQRIVDVYIIFIKIKIKMNSATNRRTINFFNVIPEWFISVVILCKTFFNDEII